MHTYAKDRAYLITESSDVHYTTDKGASWNKFTAPSMPNSLGIPLLDFHPIRPDWLIWTGMAACEQSDSKNCRAIAYYTKDNGRHWYKIDEYVRICSWGRDKALRLDEKIIFCESYRDKKGSQRSVYADNNPLQLVSGEFFYGTKKVLFPSIVGFATFEEYMVVAEVRCRSAVLLLQQLTLLTPRSSTRLLAPSGSRSRSTARTLHSLASRPTCTSRTRCAPVFAGGADRAQTDAHRRPPGVHRARIDDRLDLPARHDARGPGQRVGQPVQVQLERDVLLALARVREPERQRLRRL